MPAEGSAVAEASATGEAPRHDELRGDVARGEPADQAEPPSDDGATLASVSAFDADADALVAAEDKLADEWFDAGERTTTDASPDDDAASDVPAERDFDAMERDVDAIERDFDAMERELDSMARDFDAMERDLESVSATSSADEPPSDTDDVPMGESEADASTEEHADAIARPYDDAATLASVEIAPPPREAYDDEATVHATPLDPTGEPMEDSPTRIDTRSDGAPFDDDETRHERPGADERNDFTDGGETAALGAEGLPSEDEATNVLVSSVSEEDAIVPVGEADAPDPAPERAYSEAPTIGEIHREPPAARPQEPYVEAGTEVAPETHVVRARTPHDELVRQPVSLDASTEIVQAYDATAPAQGRGTPMFSTEVKVTGIATDEATSAAVPELKARAPHYRRVIERDAGGMHDPAEMLRRAREADFSEEATEVPPERATDSADVGKRPAPSPRPRDATQRVVRTRPKAPSRANRIVGIDLGGQWIRIGLYENAEIELVAAAASPYIPAIVASRKDGSLVAGIKARAIANDAPDQGVAPRSVLQAIKNGRIDSSRTSEFAVVASEGEDIKLQLGEHVVSLVDILVAQLSYLRKAIVDHLGTEAFGVALLVPDQLDPTARRILQNACRQARLDVSRLVPESEAVLRAYNLEERRVSSVLIVDVGMTHVGISVATRGDGGFTIAASKWDSEMSARTLDERVVQLTLDELAEQTGEDHRADHAARIRLEEAVEHARLDIRRAASVELKVTLPAPGGASGVVVERSIQLPRSRIYQVTEDVVRDICLRVQETAKRAGIDPRTIDCTVLAGSGGTFPPLVEAIASLTQQEPLQAIPPAQVFAHGLARSGAALERAESASQPDTLNASIGFELPGGRFRPLIQAGSKLPVSLSKSYPTMKDGQSELELKFYQGDAEFTRTCTFLGSVTLSGLPRGLRGDVRIDLDVSVAADGVLTVAMSEKSNNVHERITVGTAQTPTERRRAVAASRPPPKPEAPAKTGGFFSKLFGRK